MIKDMNDTPQSVQDLVSWIRDLPAHVNLIQLNRTEFFPEQPSTDDAVEAFAAELDRHQIPHTVRQHRGAGILAGCGQLRSHQVHGMAT